MDSHNLSNRNGVLFNPKVGTAYEYKINETKEIEQTIGAKENKVKLTFACEIGLQYKILDKSNNGNYEIFVQFDHYIVDNRSDNGIEDDYGEKDSTLHQKDLGAFKNATFTFNLAANGKIENIKGYNEFKKRYDILNYTNKATGDGFISFPDAFFKEEYFKDIFEKISGVLPDEMVFIKSSWLRKTSLEIGDPQNLTAQYTLYGIQDRNAYIKATSPVEQKITALNHSVSLKGKEDGVIEIEAETGMLIISDRKSSIKGNLKIGGAKVNVIVNRSSMIIGKKLKTV